MNKKEKVLFLQLIMENIVEGAGSNLHNYVEDSLNIACELNFMATINKLHDFKKTKYVSNGRGEPLRGTVIIFTVPLS